MKLACRGRGELRLGGINRRGGSMGKGCLGKALRALRKVKTDKGQVRYGWHIKADGSKAPKFHSSEVACMAFAIQEILIEEDIIDELGFPKKSIKLFLFFGKENAASIFFTSSLVAFFLITTVILIIFIKFNQKIDSK